MNSPLSPPRLNVLAGATACGKSAVGLLLAEKLGAEILSIDSMKLYRGLDIGTGKPSPAERARVPHHWIDVKDPWESASVAEFMSCADTLIASGRALIGEGGTALYLKSLCEGLFDGPGRDSDVRAKLERQVLELGSSAMHERLKAIDPKAGAKILPTDGRRIVRALEVFEISGTPLGEMQRQWGVPRTDLDVRIACLNLPRGTLYDRIDARIRAMVAAGWLDECRALLKLEKPLSREASQALGYKTFFEHLRGEMTLDAAIERVCFDTHHFARRQIHWYKRLPNVTFVEIDGTESAEDIAARVEKVWAVAR